MTNTETNTVTTNNEGNNGEVVEAEAKIATNSAKSNNSNNDIGRGNNKSNYVATKSLKRPDKNENKIMRNNVKYE